jgi:hypothetical protein
MADGEAAARAEGRREAAPAAMMALVLFVVLALVSRAQGWELLGLRWWVWLLVAAPLFLLAVDLVLSYSGLGLVRSRRAALFLLSLLVLGNFVGLGILVASLVSESSAELTGGELLLTGFAIWAADVVVFGLLFWKSIPAGLPRAQIPRHA